MKAYVYKILFEDGKWYYGLRRIGGKDPHADGYYGSPVTNKEHWIIPHSKIVLKVFEDCQAAAEYENNLIRPDLNNPLCLNECASLTFSYEVNIKAREKAVSLRRGSSLSKEHRENIGKALRGRKVSPGEVRRLQQLTAGMSWWNDGKVEILVLDPPKEMGWESGRLKIYGGSRNKGMKWYHKEGKQKMFTEDPGDGWILGRPRESGKKYYNNGTEHVLARECPGEGWILGRLKKR
jgi:hypothetical protein